MIEHRRLLFISVLVLSALFFIGFFFYDYIPKSIPGTLIRIDGAYMLICYAGTYYISFNRLLRAQAKHIYNQPFAQRRTVRIRQFNLKELVLFGGLIALLSAIIFQFYRQFNVEGIANVSKLWAFFTHVINMTIVGVIAASLIAIDFKLKNRLHYYMILGGFLLVYYITQPYTMHFLFLLKD